MLFNSFEFCLFFVVVYGLYCVLRHRAQNYLLLAASYVFYGFWEWKFLSLIVISTVVDYFVAQGIQRAPTQRGKKWLLAVSVTTNLSILGTFKYFNFFADSFGRLLNAVGLSMDVATLEILLPVGISFYTFQTLSYTIDVYRGKLEPTRRFTDFALFVAFFPQLVAGPIERAVNLLPQILNKRHLSYAMVREGLWLVLLGYTKKLVIADNMIPFTQPIFEDPELASGLAVLIGIYAFAIQIYADFSGYSDIARGLGKMMGFELMLNFNRPYFAINPKDFWRRWHISLSTWLRDYLYVSCGGNRHGTLRTYRNLMITMLLGGLWHGAAWNFVAWGLFHGSLLIVHRAAEPHLARLTPTGEFARKVWHVGLVIVFFQITCVGWLLFAVGDLADVPLLLGNMVAQFSINGLPGLASIVLFAFPLLLAEYWAERANKPLIVSYWGKGGRLIGYATAVALIVFCGWNGSNEFLYFQF